MHVIVIAVVECDVFGGQCGLLYCDFDLLLIELLTAAALAAGRLKVRYRDAESEAGTAGRAGRAEQDSSKTSPASFQQLFVAIFWQAASQSPDHATGLAWQIRAFVLSSGQFQFGDWQFGRDVEI